MFISPLSLIPTVPDVPHFCYEWDQFTWQACRWVGKCSELGLHAASMPSRIVILFADLSDDAFEFNHRVEMAGCGYYTLYVSPTTGTWLKVVHDA